MKIKLLILLLIASPSCYAQSNNYDSLIRALQPPTTLQEQLKAPDESIKLEKNVKPEEISEMEKLFNRLDDAASGKTKSGYATGAVGKIEYNSEIGESEYDEGIITSIDLDQKNPEESLKQYRESKAGQSEIWLLIFLFLIFAITIFLISAWKRKKELVIPENFGDPSESEGSIQINKPDLIFSNSESKSRLVIEATTNIRTDGYYTAKTNIEGNNLSLLFFFTSKNFAAYHELECADGNVLTTEECKEVIARGEDLEEIEISEYLTEVNLMRNEVSMCFYDPKNNSNMDINKVLYPEPMIYKKWFGKIIPKGMVLTSEVKGFNNELKDYEKKILIKDLEFNFVSVK